MKKTDSSNSIDRRKFIGGCGAMGSLPLYSSLLNLKMMGNVAAQSTSGDPEYKALVCIFLEGGNDSYNMLVPTSSDEYANYQSIRTNLALPNNGTGAVLPLNRVNSPKTPENNDRDFSLHPSMGGMQSIFNQGNLAFVSNVGTLIEPTTIEQVRSGSFLRPRALFSHNSQQHEWQTSVPQDLDHATGWLGRVADIINQPSAGFNNSSVSMNISLSGNNVLQLGSDTFVYTISGSGSLGLTRIDVPVELFSTPAATTRSILEQSYQNIYEESFAIESSRSYSSHENFSEAFEEVQINTIFPDTLLGRDLRGVAQSIGSGTAVGSQRQTYFVRTSGWDQHINLLSNQAPLLEQLDDAVTAFWNALVELGMEDQVILFSSSDFSRTLRSNGVGSDHAWGGNHFVMGGSIDGAKVYGKYPDPGEFTIFGGLDVGTTGQLLPSLSTDEYFAELALWLGVPSSDLDQVLPNLNNFWDGSGAPIGYVS